MKLDQIWKILSVEEKNKSKYFLFLTLLNTLIEISIVLAIVPLTQILLNQDVQIPYFGEINFFSDYSYSFVVLSSILFMLIIFLLKNIFYTYFMYWQFKFVGKIELRLSSKLLEKYLYRPYLYHLNSNSGILNNNVLNEIQHIPGNILQILTLISEIIILIFIGAILIIFEPIGSISVIIVSIILVILLNGIQRKYMSNFGHQRYLYMGNSNKHLLQGLQNIKDIKLLNKEKYFLKNYFNNFKSATKYKVLYDSLSVTPRPISEIILVSAFAILVYVLVGKNDPNIIILTTSLFLIATYRLLPSIVRITSAYQSIQLRKKVVEELILDLTKYDKEIYDEEKYLSVPDLIFNSKICLKNISFQYPNTSKKVLNNINLEINKGEMIGIVGPSGTGKTTFIDVILGLLEPTSGEIYIDKTKITNENLKKWQKFIGYVPQNPTFIDDTIKKNIAFGVDEKKIDQKLLDDCIKKSNLINFLENQNNGINTMIGEKGVRISGGQKQRIAIARSLYRNPDIIIFDEATSSLDEKNEDDIINNISLLKGYKTTIVIAHKMKILKNCDKILKIIDGNIIN